MREIQVPFSSGRNVPRTAIPADACDCHHHIYDPLRFPYLPTDVRNQPPSTVACYRLLKKRLGIARNVIVQPSAYGTDNACTLDALQQLGDSARAIVVVDESISDEELRRMHTLGVRGLRYNINCGGSDDFDAIRRMAERITPMGWVICFWMSADLLVEKETFLRDLPCEAVIDHRGHIPASAGMAHPAVDVLCRMLADQKVYAKLSGLYIDSARSDYADTIAIGKAYVQACPDRVLWGSDWPHPSCYSSREPVPNDADLLDFLLVQAGSKEVFDRILVDNPARLFGFHTGDGSLCDRSFV